MLIATLVLQYGYVLLAPYKSGIIPYSLHLTIGDKAQFTCRSWNVSLWFYSKQGLTPKSPPIHSTKTMVKLHVNATDTGIYFCFGLDIFNKKSFLAKAILKVFGKHNVRMPEI